MAAGNTSGSAHRLTSLTGGNLQPGRLGTQRLTTRPTVGTRVRGTALRTRGARLLKGSQTTPTFPFLLIMNACGETPTGQQPQGLGPGPGRGHKKQYSASQTTSRQHHPTTPPTKPLPKPDSAPTLRAASDSNPAGHTRCQERQTARHRVFPSDGPRTTLRRATEALPVVRCRPRGPVGSRHAVPASAAQTCGVALRPHCW